MTAREGKLKQHTRNDHMESSDSALLQRISTAADFIERVRSNQQQLAAELKSHYDFIVCGSGSSGSVVAGRLAENPDVSMLRLRQAVATTCPVSWKRANGL